MWNFFDRFRSSFQRSQAGNDPATILVACLLSITFLLGLFIPRNVKAKSSGASFEPVHGESRKQGTPSNSSSERSAFLDTGGTVVRNDTLHIKVQFPIFGQQRSSQGQASSTIKIRTPEHNLYVADTVAAFASAIDRTTTAKQRFGFRSGPLQHAFLSTPAHSILRTNNKSDLAYGDD